MEYISGTVNVNSQSIFLKENNLSTNAFKYTEIPDRLKLTTEYQFHSLFILDTIKHSIKLLNADMLCINIIQFLMYIVMITIFLIM